jgi:hypothetical protein
MPYVHGGELYCCVCVALFNAELNLHKVDVVLYSRLPRLFKAQSTGQLH